MSIWVLTVAVLGFFLSYVLGHTHRRLRAGLALVFLTIAALALIRIITNSL